MIELAKQVPEPRLLGPAASAVILADRQATSFTFRGLPDALSTEQGEVDIRLFGKPATRAYRRMGVALARAADVETARTLAVRAAERVRIDYGDQEATS